MSAWTQRLTNLQDVLSDLFFTPELARVVVDEAQIPHGFINYGGGSIVRWHSILGEADNRHKVDELIAAALKRHPENSRLAAAARGDLTDLRGTDIDEGLGWRGKAPADGLEKIMEDQSTLLPIAFLEQGLAQAEAVVKVCLPDGSGSGFLTGEGLLVTNHHVIGNANDATRAVILFNYQETVSGLSANVIERALDPGNGFATSGVDDWTAVKVAGNLDGLSSLELCTADPQVGDRVSVIQHPGGGYKQIALHHNLVAFVGESRVQYLTDTEPGSSGSPVFDQSWHVVALHHSGGWIREPGTQRLVYRNEGIHINAVVSGMQQSGLI